MPQTINLQEIDKPAGVAAAVLAVFQGFVVGDTIELTLWEDDTQDSMIPSPNVGSVQKIGSIVGELLLLNNNLTVAPLLTLKPTKVTPTAKSKLKLLVVFAQPDGASSLTAGLFLPDERLDKYEGDSWEVFATIADAPDAQSPTTRLARVRRSLSVRKGEATYNFYTGHSCRFYHDGSTDIAGSGGYFRNLQDAIQEAQDFIFISDWSFQPHMRLVHDGRYDIESTIGYQLIDKARKNPEMVIAIHTWDHTSVAASDTSNDDADNEFAAILRHAFSSAPKPSNLLWRKSSRSGGLLRTGIGYSHHQKFVAMDSKGAESEGRRRLRGFMGGFDITKGRFDFPGHPILPLDPADGFSDALAYVNAGIFIFDDWYNAEFYPNLQAVIKPPTFPRQPWHDIALYLMGPAVYDIVREFVGRWRNDPNRLSSACGDTNAASIAKVTNKYIELLTRLKDPAKPHNPVTNYRMYCQQWEAGTGPWAIQVYRSLRKEHWEATPPLIIKMPDGKRNEFRWTYNGDYEASIQGAYVQAIRQAENFVYIETQYFISSGSMWSRPTVANVIAINLALRAIERFKAKAPFHIYLVIPMFPEGSPGDPGNCAQRQFEWASIRAMITMIEAQTGKDAAEFLSVFFLANWEDLSGGLPNVGGTRQSNVIANRRYQIYVHAKFMLIDDRYMIIGSANLNERSLNGGRDSEIAVGVWPNDDRSIQTCIDECRGFRRAIWSEHLGPKFPPPEVEDPSSPACIKAIRDSAAENYKAFREGRRDNSQHAHLCLWPLLTKSSTSNDDRSDPILHGFSKAPEMDHFIPDRPFGLAGHELDAWLWHAPGSWSELILKFTGENDETAE